MNHNWSNCVDSGIVDLIKEVDMLCSVKKIENKTSLGLDSELVKV